MDKSDEQTQKVSDYWRARFEFGEMPELLKDFSTEEHVRILLSRIQKLEKRTRDLE